MKNQALFSSKDKSKKLKCCLLQFLFGALRVKSFMWWSRHCQASYPVRVQVLLFLAHLSTKCSWWAIVISLCLSSVRCQLFALNNFSSKTARRILNNFTGRFLGWPSTKIAQILPLRWTRWPPELKIEKPLNFFSWTRRWILKQLYRNVSWVTLYQNC